MLLLDSGLIASPHWIMTRLCTQPMLGTASEVDAKERKKAPPLQ
jgi:hypothetical protein